ncbi:MAG: TonB-dependent receptor, partial [Gemmatimonadota bacterium]|nr:TonB-dependent receptor [Gemmatimonadota bacterium]
MFRLLALAQLAFAAVAVPWQRATAQATRVKGVVIDSVANRPLGDVRIQVRGTQWTTRTRADGRFTIPVPATRAVIVAQRLGYGVAEVTIEPATLAASDSIVIRLAERPAAISGVLVEEAAAPPMAQTITPATVRHLPPLLEPDIFRAISFVPGVLQPSDLRGRMHIAGGRSDETAIRVNGHPLHNPFHLAELMSGFSVAAVERADVLMHHMPPEYSDHLSGVVDITTRRPRARSANEVVVSLVSSSITSAQPQLPGGFALLASGRVTYLDKFLRLRYSEEWLRDEGVPLYGFVDGVVTAERAWANGTRLQLTGFGTRDQIDLAGDQPTGFRPYGWGEWLLGASIGRAVGTVAWDVRASLGRGIARYDSGLDRQPGQPVPEFEPRQQLGTSHDRVSAMGRVAWQRERWAATAGLTFDSWRGEQSWRGTEFLVHPDAPFRFAGSDGLDAASAVATVALAPRARVSAGAHTRLWLANGRLWPAPGAWLGARITPSLSAQLALERRFQFEAELAEPVLGIGRAPVFLLDVPREARVAGLQLAWTGAPRRPASEDSSAAEHALSDAGPLQLRVQAFFKQYTRGTRLPERPILTAFAPLDTNPPSGFPNFARGDGRSYGVMIGGRLQPHRRLFVEGGYTYQRALEEVDGVLSPTAWDAPHQVSSFASFLLSRKWTLNVSGQARSGLPQTGVARRIVVPILGGGFTDRYVPGPRNGVQLPPYYRLDLGVRRTSSEGRVAWTFNFQLLNLFFKRNATAYNWPAYFCSIDPEDSCGRAFGLPEPIESFSLPIVPSFG